MKLVGRYKIYHPTAGGHVNIRDTLTGQLIHLSTGESNRAAATQAAERWLELLPAGQVSVPVRQAVRMWLEHCRGLSQHTIDYYAETAGLLVSVCENKPLAAVTPLDIDRCMEALTCGPNRRRVKFSILNVFFRWCLGRDLIEKSPMRGMRRPRGAEPRRPVRLTYEGAARLVAGCSGNARRGLLLCLYTGLRRRNLEGLRWDQVDLDGACLKLGPQDMKSRRSFWAPLHPVLVQEMRLWPRLGEKVLEGGPGVRGPGVRWHDARHSFAAWMSNEPYVVVETLLGHATSDVTMVYAHASEEMLRAAVEKLPDFRQIV